MKFLGLCQSLNILTLLKDKKNIYLEDSDSDSFVDKDDGMSPKVREILNKIKKNNIL